MRRQPNPSLISYRAIPWVLPFLLIFLNAVLVTEATAQNNPRQVVGKMIDLFQQLQRHKAQPTAQTPTISERAPQTVPAPENQSIYKVGDIRLGQQIDAASLGGYTSPNSSHQT